MERFIKPRDSTLKYDKYLVFLKDIQGLHLQINPNDCRDRIIYHVVYKKNLVDDFNFPVYFVIPKFYGRVYHDNFCDYLTILSVQDNMSVLTDYELLWDEVLCIINKLNSTNHKMTKNHYDIKLGDSVKKMPVGGVLKISYAVVSFNVLLEKDGEIMAENFLQDCFYEINDVREIINDEFEIIENKK